MEFNQSCEFAPMFIVADGVICFPCNEDFIANEMVRDESGFDVKTFNGCNFYPMRWLVGRGWFSSDFLHAFIQWADENGIESEDVMPSMDITWITKSGTGPEFVRSIGFASDGDAYVALKSIDLPDEGLEAKTTVYLGEDFVSVQDYAKADPEGFDKTILGVLLPALAEKHGCKCNAFE